MNVVSWPWPWFLVPMNRVALPLGAKRISANSGCGPAARSMALTMREAAELAARAARPRGGRESGDVGELQRVSMLFANSPQS